MVDWGTLVIVPFRAVIAHWENLLLPDLVFHRLANWKLKLRLLLLCCIKFSGNKDNIKQLPARYTYDHSARWSLWTWWLEWVTIKKFVSHYFIQIHIMAKYHWFLFITYKITIKILFEVNSYRVSASPCCLASQVTVLHRVTVKDQ